ncbi:unnamed protein product [Effrenium voratum]|uniref:WW domain-containing protein n=1 Tax=Effrenium voratum TaxID=2562239 RepID=A0AA36MJZ9_9DINO|nr:unnamed protein product [Effrenium voratum]
MSGMLRGLRNTLSKSKSNTGLAAGSGAQAASVINSQPSASNQPEHQSAGESASQPIPKAASPPPSAQSRQELVPLNPTMADWTFEEQWSYVESLGIVKQPGEEHIIRFLADGLNASPMPAPWTLHRDEEKRIFYGNTSTGETTWAHPLEDVVRELSGVCRVCVSMSRAMREQALADLRIGWEAQAKEEFSQWYGVKDPSSGKDYYCHAQTGDTMWEHPAEVLLPAHFLKLKSADRLMDEAYLQDLADLGNTLNASMGRSWNSMKRTLESSSTGLPGSIPLEPSSDAHQAIKEELASCTVELQNERESSSKLKAEFEALKQRFEIAQKTADATASQQSVLLAELKQQELKLQAAVSECEAWKSQATMKEGSQGELQQQQVALQVEMDAERAKAAEALAEVEALKAKAAALSESSGATEKAKAEIEAQLAAEKRRADEAQTELQQLDARAKEKEQHSAKAEDEKKQIQAQLEAERLRIQKAEAEMETLKGQSHAQSQEGAAVLEQKKEVEGQLALERSRTQQLLAEKQNLESHAAKKLDPEEAERQKKEIQDQLEEQKSHTQQLLAELEVLKSSSNEAQGQAAEAAALLAQKKEVEDQLAEERTRTQQLLAEKQDIESHAARKLDPEEAERQKKEIQDQLEAKEKHTQQLQAELEALKGSSSDAQLQAAEAAALLAQKKEVEDQLAEERTRTQQLLAEKQDIESHAARKLDPEEAERQKKEIQDQLEAKEKHTQQLLAELEALKGSSSDAQLQAAEAAALLAQKKEVEDQLAEERSRTQQLLAEKQDLESHVAKKLDPEEAERQKKEIRDQLESKEQHTQQLLAELAEARDTAKKDLEAERAQRAQAEVQEVQAQLLEGQQRLSQLQAEAANAHGEEKVQLQEVAMRELEKALELEWKVQEVLGQPPSWETRLDAEQKRAEQALQEFNALKKERDQDAEALIEEERQREELRAELAKEKTRAEEAIQEAAALKAQAQLDAACAVEEEKARQKLQEELEAERRRAEHMAHECEVLRQAAPANLQTAVEEERQRYELQQQLTTERKRGEEAMAEIAVLKQQAELQQTAEEEAQKALKSQLEAERQLAAEAQAECAALKKQQSDAEALAQERASKEEAAGAKEKSLQDEVQQLKEAANSHSAKVEDVERQRKLLEEQLVAESKLVEQMRAERDSLATSQSKPPPEAAGARRESLAKELQEELKMLQAAASRAQEAETALHAKLESVQTELSAEKSKASQATSRLVAVQDVKEAMVQELISANLEKRSLRESLEKQLAEQKRRASNFEAQLRALSESGEGGSLELERLKNDQLQKEMETLEQSTVRLQEQLAKAHVAANQLEAKFNQERLQLETAKEDRREVQRPAPSAETAETADLRLQQHIASARQVEEQLSTRAVELKTLMEEERQKLEQLMASFSEPERKPRPELERQLQELNEQMADMRSTLKGLESRPPSRAGINEALSQVAAANLQIQAAVVQEKDVLKPKVLEPSCQKSEGPQKKLPKGPRVREYQGKLWAATDDAIQTGHKVRHMKIESALVHYQTKLCKDMMQEMDSSRIVQTVNLAKSKSELKALNGSLREQLEQAKAELALLEARRG